MHLKKKYRDKLKKEAECPEGLKRYSDLTIFNKEKLGRKKEVSEIHTEIAVIGTEINSEEKSFLELPPKYSIYKKLGIEDFEVAFEICNTKIRYDVKRNGDEELDTQEEVSEEEKEKFEEIEAETRQVYDPLRKTVNLNNRRVTDLKENAKVYLPKPLKPVEEHS